VAASSRGPNKRFERTAQSALDHGVSGATTGSGTFRDDGTFIILGTVTYPGEPADSLAVSGTYQVVATIVTLTTPDGTGAWSMAFSGDRVVLALVGADPPTSITLKKQLTSMTGAAVWE